MGLTRTVLPTTEIVTLGEAKDQLRVKDTNSDADIERMIKAATGQVQTFIRGSLITQTWEYTLNAFPVGNVQLPMSPLQSITDIKYIDENGTEQTWAATEYDVFINTMPGFFKLGFDKTYPTTRKTQDAIKITYIAGYSRRENIPPEIIQAALLMIGHYFEHREEGKVGGKVEPIPMGFETLLYPYRMFTP